MRYYRACSSHHDFLDRRLRQTRKLLNQIRKFYCRQHDLMNIYRISVSRICSLCRNYNPVRSSFMIYHRVFNMSNTARRVLLVEQELLTLPEHLRSHRFVMVFVLLYFLCYVRGPSFVILSLFVWPSYCLSFFALSLYIIPLVSSDFPYIIKEVVLSLLKSCVSYIIKGQGYIVVLLVCYIYNLHLYNSAGGSI